MVINTYKRPDLLKNAVQHYAHNCRREAGVEQIFVIWSELDKDPPPSPEDILFDAKTHSPTLRSNRLPKDDQDLDKVIENNSNTRVDNAPSLEFIRTGKEGEHALMNAEAKFIGLSATLRDLPNTISREKSESCMSVFS